MGTLASAIVSLVVVTFGILILAGCIVALASLLLAGLGLIETLRNPANWR